MDRKTAGVMAARKRVLTKLIEGPDAKGLYADPAALFQ